MADIITFDHVTIDHQGRRGAATRILDDVSLRIGPGEALGLVGESGCGKSTIALAAMHYLPQGMRVATGRILLEDRDLTSLDGAELRRLRGNRIAMIYQDPMSSLNPVMTIGDQLIEVPMLHGETSRSRGRDRAIAMLGEVRLSDPAAYMTRYPHQLSGGQQQRVVIAMALMAEPSLLIMDEPTTGLDVTIEAAILELVRDLRTRFGAAILFISHNLGTVARICDRIGVLYAGRLVEEGPIGRVFRAPAHPYTRGLLAALPRLDTGGRSRRLTPIDGVIAAADRARIGCAFAPRCAFHHAGACDPHPITMQPIGAGHAARCARLHALPTIAETQAHGAAKAANSNATVILSATAVSKDYKLGGRFGGGGAKTVRAVTDVSFDARAGQTLAIVGESGCGKSTLAKVIAGLVEGSSGDARFNGVNLAVTPVDQRTTDLRRRIQMVFQNPNSTLNPSHTVEFALTRPLRRLKGLSRAAAKKEVRDLIQRVRLPAELLRRLPHQLSGGQRQRVAIARALAGNPDLLIADEPVSALDVSVQASIVNLLGDLLETSPIGVIIISHDLALIRHMADWVAVMYLGRIVEYGPADQVLAPPFHPYTEALLAAAPTPDPDAGPAKIVLGGTMPSATAKIQGCAFASRCPAKIGTMCETTAPPVRGFGAHSIACHHEFSAVVPAPPSLAEAAP